MRLSEIVDTYGLRVIAEYKDSQWTYSCPSIIKANGACIAGSSGHPLDALAKLAKSASGRHLTIVTINLQLNPIAYEGW